MEEKPDFRELQKIPLKLNLAISLLVGAFSIIYWLSVLYAIAIFSFLYLVKMENSADTKASKSLNSTPKSTNKNR